MKLMEDIRREVIIILMNLPERKGNKVADYPSFYDEKKKSIRFFLYNGNIITMDRRLPKAEAVAVDEGWIYRVGSNQDLKGLIERGFTAIDLQGKTLLPGFIDTHCHLEFTGLFYTGVKTDNAGTMDDILQCISDRAAKTRKGGWISLYQFDEKKINSGRMPGRAELDGVAPNNPVMVHHYSNEVISLNSKAIKALKIKKRLEGAGLEGGHLTGIVGMPGVIKAIRHYFTGLPYDTISEAYLSGAQIALENGVTTIHPTVGGRLAPKFAWYLINTEYLLPVHTILWNASSKIGKTLELGLRRVGGCGDLKADGMINQRTGALFEPYSDDPENYGVKNYPQEFWDRFIGDSHRMGLQIAIHANGSAGIEQVLFALEKAIRHYPRENHRHRLDHLELPTLNQMTRIAHAGIMASVLPSFLGPAISGENLSLIRSGIGERRVARFHPYRSMIDNGIRLCGGSGTPETPFNPLLGIHMAVNHPNPAERLTVQEALEMWTVNGAVAGFEENEKGTIQRGKLADMVILSEDPFEVSPEKIKEIKVEKTIVSGVAHSPGDFEHPDAYRFGRNLKQFMGI